MNFTRPPYWHEGMFLRPQHFQCQDRYHESLTHSLFAQSNPNYWGVNTLEVSNTGLDAAQFEIERMDVVFPDGARVVVPGNGMVGSRSFESSLPPGSAPLPVYLGLKVLKESESNVLEDGATETGTARFSVKDREGDTFDLFAEQRPQTIQYLYYQTRLFFGSEIDNSADHQVLKIAEVVPRDKGFSLSAQYTPPSASLGADKNLLGLVKSVRDQVTAKGRELAALKRERTVQTYEVGSRDALYLFFSLALNSYIPLLHHVCETPGAAHPWQVYGLLREITGMLSSFSGTVGPLGAINDEDPLPAYDHSDLWTCFQAAAGRIETLLGELIAGSGYSVKLIWDGEYYSADLDERVFAGNNEFYLTIITTVPLNELLPVMKDTAKICSSTGMPNLISRALFGVPPEHLPSPPHQLPRKPNAVYFKLDKGSNIWPRLEKDKNIAIWFETKLDEAMDIELTVLFDES